LARDLYLALSPADRIRFEREYATLFFVHAATQPPVNAEKMLALMRAGILTVERLGSSYRVEGGPDGTGFRFRYGDAGNRRAEFRYLVDARGQDCCVFTDDSTLTRNLIRSGTVQVGEAQVPEQGPDQPLVAVPTSQKPRPACASVSIDPRSHRVMQGAPGGTLRPSPWLYAVGAMTRAQILDVSMARSLARSTDRVAEQLVDWLVRNP
jgi:hypothetical protein